MDADIHVVHSHIPDQLYFNKKSKIILIEHGSPEHNFEMSVTQGHAIGAYGPGDPFAIVASLTRRADAVVTFWPRHAEIWASMTHNPVYCVPMGIPTAFWTNQGQQNMLSGSPSILTAENCHTCKWPLDILIQWPWIVQEMPLARLHVIHLPMDQHRWWWPLAYLNGSIYTSFLSPVTLGKEHLRDFFSCCTFYYNPCQYGDFNRVGLEAAATGAKIISFEGNEYAHYWITEGDQRRQKDQMIAILRGEVAPREPLRVHDIADTVAAMMEIYKILGAQCQLTKPQESEAVPESAPQP